MALIHRARLTPSKLELLSSWLPSRPWNRGSADGGLTQLGAYRFDDPDGEVGIETILVRAGDGPVLQVPLTYRGAPLDGADDALVGTMEHSVLGTRWAYDATADPVHAAVLLATMLDGGTGAREQVESGGELVDREPTATVRGSGRGAADGRPDPSTDAAEPTLVRTGGWTIAVRRVLDVGVPDAPGLAEGVTLTGTWAGGPDEVLLAYAWES